MKNYLELMATLLAHGTPRITSYNVCYTKLLRMAGLAVPEVLLSGNHEGIRQWRLKQALGRTWLRRPELLNNLALTDEQEKLSYNFV